MQSALYQNSVFQSVALVTEDEAVIWLHKGKVDDEVKNRLENDSVEIK